MYRFIHRLILCFTVLFLFGCKEEKGFHEFIRGDLSLPQDIEWGGFYCEFDEPPLYAVISEGKINYVERISNKEAREVDINTITNYRPIFVYCEATSNWTELTAVLNEIAPLGITEAYVAYEEHNDSRDPDDITVCHVLIKSLPEQHNHDIIYDFEIQKDASIIDLKTNRKYDPVDSENSYEQMKRIFTETKQYRNPAIFLRGSGDSQVSEFIDAYALLEVSFDNVYLPLNNLANQQVEPIVTTPVDEVEAQSTQAHP